MASAVLIETPTDFGNSMVGLSYHQHMLCKVRREIEPTLRHALDAIFNDSVYVDRQDPAMVSYYLDSIEEPLRTLDSLGATLFAVTIKGTRTIEGKKIAWPTTHYFVVIKDAYFAIGDDPSAHHVHRFSPNCQGAIEDLASICINEEGITVYPDKRLLITHYEGSVPWCPDCCLSDVGTGE